MRAAVAAALLLALGACGSGESEIARPARAAPPVPVPTSLPPTPSVAASPSGVTGRDARALIAMFGRPQIDVQEGKGRKLQFAGAQCVLDVYLYPRGRGELVATHLETRLRDGRAVDPASCIATLRRGP